VVDLGLVLLKAFDDDVVEDLAHLSFGLGVVHVEQHLVLGVGEQFHGSLFIVFVEQLEGFVQLGLRERSKEGILIFLAEQSKSRLQLDSDELSLGGLLIGFADQSKGGFHLGFVEKTHDVRLIIFDLQHHFFL
jgi:hypothetical protein